MSRVGRALSIVGILVLSSSDEKKLEPNTYLRRRSRILPHGPRGLYHLILSCALNTRPVLGSFYIVFIFIVILISCFDFHDLKKGSLLGPLTWKICLRFSDYRSRWARNAAKEEGRKGKPDQALSPHKRQTWIKSCGYSRVKWVGSGGESCETKESVRGMRVCAGGIHGCYIVCNVGLVQVM